jgi:hypothetical protein
MPVFFANVVELLICFKDKSWDNVCVSSVGHKWHNMHVLVLYLGNMYNVRGLEVKGYMWHFCDY